ncbi:MAG TPA: DUF4115 domain-containing protein [Alphaproteobacteria bacterium]|nr:DUF4115 domain-containing protein [Alphaproteobacteria bacterium]
MPPEAETRAGSPQPAKNDGGRGVGALLRASRLRCGEELADIAQILRVRLPYLEAIEEGRFGDLPGNTYAIGFIRSYADYLGLDSGEVVRRYKEDVADANKKSDLDFPVPVPESGIPGGAVLFIGVAIAILAYGGWYASTTKSGFLAELISPIPKKLSSLSPKAEKSKAKEKVSLQATGKNNSAPLQSPDKQGATAAAAAADDGNVAAATKTEKVSMTAEKPEPEKAGASPAPEAKTDAAQAKMVETAKTPETPTPVVMESTLVPPPAAPPALQTPPTPKAVSTQKPAAPAVTRSPELTTENKSAANPKAKTPKMAEKPHPKVVSVSINADEAVKSGSDSGRIVIRAKANSWIQIRDDIENQLVVTRLLRPGDSYRVPNRPGLKLLTGNAGALEVLVDGKAAPAIGGKGAVRRSIVLNVKRLLQGTAVVE